MASESTVKLTIALNEPDLDEERLDQTTRQLLRDIKYLDEVEQASLAAVAEMPEGAKASGGLSLGSLEIILKILNFPAFMSFLSERLFGKGVELEVEANGKKLKVKAVNQQELRAAIREAELFIAAV